MTAALDEFTGWRHSIEVRLGRLEAASDMNAANLCDHKGMIRAMDKDVSDAQAAFRAQLAVLNSVRVTQSEHTAKIRSIDNRLAGVEIRLTSVEGTLQKVNVGVQTIIGLLVPANGHGESGGDSTN